MLFSRLFVTILLYAYVNQMCYGKNYTDSIQLKSLEGKWHIHLSSLPMWAKGDKTNPSLNYTLEKRSGKMGLVDVVLFTKNNKEKSIAGFDKVIGTNAFVWRGKGVLKVLKSNWEILYVNQSEGWAITHFEKTLFTPEGYDIISRNKKIDDAVLQKIKTKLNELNVKMELKVIPQG